jgi:hypothetical protein
MYCGGAVTEFTEYRPEFYDEYTLTIQIIGILLEILRGQFYCQIYKWRHECIQM